MNTYINLSRRAFSSAANKNIKYFFFFGAPGVGKGTYASRFCRDTGFKTISTGDELRRIVKEDASSTYPKDLVDKIKATMQAGKLVGDDILIDIIRRKVQDPEITKGVVFDGFPRTIQQLDLYKQNFPVDLVVNIILREDILVEKLAGRRVCSGCGENYNISSIKREGYDMDPLNPKKEGICDKCGGNLVIRSDDTVETIRARLTEYENKTAPVLNAFKKSFKVLDFEPKRGVKDYPDLLETLKPYLQ